MMVLGWKNTEKNNLARDNFLRRAIHLPPANAGAVGAAPRY
jgi:hypothetical protein